MNYRHMYKTRRTAPSGYVSITRPLARHLHTHGQAVIVCGNKVNPFHVVSGWMLGCTVSEDVDFDRAINEFLYYLEPELGKYPVFYVSSQIYTAWDVYRHKRAVERMPGFYGWENVYSA